MPIYVTLGNWTDQGTKDFGGAVQRANGFREMVEQAGGRARELVWTMGEYDFIIVGGGTRRRDGRDAGVAGGRGRDVRSKTMRVFDADQMSDIIARTGSQHGVSAGPRPWPVLCFARQVIVAMGPLRRQIGRCSVVGQPMRGLTVLLTVEEALEALRQAQSLAYRPPGG